ARRAAREARAGRRGRRSDRACTRHAGLPGRRRALAERAGPPPRHGISGSLPGSAADLAARRARNPGWTSGVARAPRRLAGHRAAREGDRRAGVRGGSRTARRVIHTGNVLFELHCHTTASDGSDPPARLAERAAERGVEVFAITDHDTVTAAAVPGAR